MAMKEAPVSPWLMERRFFTLMIALVFGIISAAAFFIGHRHHTVQTALILKGDRSTASLLSLVLDEHLKRMVSVMESYSNRPLLIQAVKGKNVEKASQHLINLAKNNPDMDIVVLSDRQGTPWASYPANSPTLGMNYAHREWYKGVSREWKTYVSDAVLRVVAEKDLAVQIGVPCFDEKGEVIGILVNTQRMVGLSRLFKQFSLDPGATVTVTDRKGQIVYSSLHDIQKEIKPYPFHSGMNQALAAKSRTFAADAPEPGGRSRYISFARIINLGWTVFVERERRSILFSDLPYFLQVVAIASLTFLTIVFFIAYLRKREMEQQILKKLQVAEILKENEENKQEILESISDAFFSLDDDMVVRYFNPAAEQMLHRKAAEVIGRPLFDAFPEARGSVFEENYARCIRTKRPLFFEVEFSVAPYENCYDVRVYPAKDGISIFFQLVTDRKRKEKMEKARLRIASEANSQTSKKLMRMALDEIEALTGSTIGFYHFILEDQETIWLQTWSTNTLQQMCTAEGEGSHYPVSKGGVWADCIRERRAIIHNDYPSLPNRRGMPPGHAAVVRELVVPIFRNGRITAVFGVGNKPTDYDESDIHLISGIGDFSWEIVERRRAEEALREQEIVYRNLFNNTEVGICRTRLDGSEVLEVNRRFLDIVGMPMEEVLGKPSVDLWADPKEREEMVKILAAEGSVSGFEFKMVNKRRGEVRNCITSLRLYREQGILEGSILDITERKRAEEEGRILAERLHSAEKMEMMGKLAGRVAHDLNNVLGVLSGYSELLTERMPEGSPLRTYAANILQSSEKAAAIVEDLLTLTRRGVRVMEVTRLNRVIGRLLATPEFDRLAAYHPDVIVKTDLAEELLNISGSPVHIEKTVMNLLSNAVESIVGVGEVTIQTENRYLDRAIEGFQTVTEGEYVVLTVADTGRGIPADDLKKIYEPFYTKKSMGRSGTGLGLAIVWGTVQDHHGSIDVRSTEGEGTTFTLYFPATREKAEEERRRIPVELYRGHGESVLVVDDVQEQREVATTLLTELGYSVNAVSSGEAAVEYLKGTGADILVLDMIMEPGIDGLDTYRRILEIHPHQKAIIVSGFSETDRTREAQMLGAGPYVKKPFLKEKIGMAIREELTR